MSEIPLTIYGEKNFQLLQDAMYNASSVSYLAFRLSISNEIIYDDSFGPTKFGSSVKKLKDCIARRLRWYAWKQWNQNRQTKNNRKSELAYYCYHCLADMVAGELTTEELKEIHGHVYEKLSREKPLDQMTVLAIEVLQKQNDSIAEEYSRKIADYTNRMFAERDAKMSEVNMQIAELIKRGRM